jgi:hypothetical protein
MRVLLGISSLAVLLGIIIILASTGWGNSAANVYLRTQAGGTMNTATFLALMPNYIMAYRQIGVIIFGGGIAGLLIVAWRWLT